MADKAGVAPVEMQSSYGPARSAWALVILVLAYILNFVDRQIVGILAVPIKAELALSDTELGMIGGLAFAIFYSSVAIPIAWIADRRSRVRIIAIACGSWSLFTALCGLTQSFWQLFAARMGVGIGEAGCVAPSYSLISDLFPRERRARAIAIYQFGIPLGSALGIFFGGWIAATIDWRAAFLIVGLAGLPVALIIWFGIREPVRGIRDGAPASGVSRLPAAVVARTLSRTPSFWFFTLGGSFSAILMFGLMFWLPSLLQRSFGLPLVEVSLYFGAIVLIGGLLGIWAGGWLADRLAQSNPRAYALIPMAALLLAAPAYTLAIFAPNAAIAFLLFIPAQVLSLVGASPIVTAVQHVVPPAMRATASSIFLLANNLLGLGFGTMFLGVMSDLMTERYGEEALKYSILCGLLFYFAAAAWLLLASLYVERDRARLDSDGLAAAA